MLVLLVCFFVKFSVTFLEVECAGMTNKAMNSTATSATIVAEVDECKEKAMIDGDDDQKVVRER